MAWSYNPPLISGEIKGGLHDHAIAVVHPVYLTQALMENATANGVRLMLETEV